MLGEAGGRKKRGGALRLPAQSADKAHKRKNCPDKKEIGGNFCFLRQLHLHPSVTYIYVSSLGCKFASLGGFAEPFGIVKSSRPRRQILPLAKFPCLQAFSTLCQSVDFVNILSEEARCASPPFRFGLPRPRFAPFPRRTRSCLPHLPTAPRIPPPAASRR